MSSGTENSCYCILAEQRMAVMRMKSTLNVRVGVFLTGRYKTAGILWKIVSDYIHDSFQKITEPGLHGITAKRGKM